MVLAAATLLAACGEASKESRVSVLTDDIVFPESVLMDDTTLLVVNFGSSEFNPLNDERKGYVLAFTDSVAMPFIKSDGILSAPKGTQIKDGKLYVADVNKLVVYQLDSLGKAPQVITLPANQIFANDLDFYGNQLYLTVSNTGDILTMDITNPADTLKTALNVPGVNGLIFNGKTAYIASFATDGSMNPENTIYVINDIENPVVEKLIDRPGKYDGLALSDDKSKLYFTNWEGGEVGVVDLATKEVAPIDMEGVIPAGPARLVQSKGVLYIPDLPNSRIIKVKL